MSIEGYSLSGYGEMIADRIRTDAYTKALRAVIRPGAIVMDIGTGPGIMAVLACQLGARHVYAIEPGEVIQVAREIAATNDCAGKIEFFEDISTNVTIPVQADVIVSDLRGILPLYSHHIPSIADARRRFLAPGGILIGREDRIWVAVVETSELYSEIVGPWACELSGLDLSPARRKVVNEICKTRNGRASLLTSPELWARLDYTQVENPDVERELSCTVKQDGMGHGIAVWFDADLAEGIGFSNCPGTPATIYSSMFLPWPEPVRLTAGQTVRVHLHAKLMEDDYFWRWVSRIEAPGQVGKIAAEFDQSVLQGAVLSPANLLKQSSKYIPQLSEEGLLRRRTLELMDTATSLEEIARRLTAEFPERFAKWQQALTFAGAVSSENSR
jgi:ribosomal protein L11 methyltransferase PrmA/PRMT5 arginine-N-methyltransferase